MPKITVRKCPKTGKLFETDAAYRKYIVKYRKARNMIRSARRVRRAAITGVRNELALIRNIPELEEYVKKSFHEIMIAYNGGQNAVLHRIICKAKMTEFTLDVRYSERCSNTHCKPRNGELNWGGREKDVPRGYPGFTGNIRYTLENDPAHTPEAGNLCLRHSNALGFAGINTGGGGGRGRNSYEYGVTIFLSDFDGLLKQHFLDKLAGTA